MFRPQQCFEGSRWSKCWGTPLGGAVARHVRSGDVVDARDIAELEQRPQVRAALRAVFLLDEARTIR